MTPGLLVDTNVWDYTVDDGEPVNRRRPGSSGLAEFDASPSEAMHLFPLMSQVESRVG